MPKFSVLLAYGSKEFSQRLKEALEKNGHAATIISSGALPKASYNFVLQLGRNPTELVEGTQLLLEKAAKDHGRFFLVTFRTEEKLYEESLNLAISLTKDYEKRLGIDSNILNLGRLYGPEISEKDSGALGHLIHEFIQGDVLTLYAEGRDKDYYIFTDDAIEGIIRALTTAKPSLTYAIAPVLPTTSQEIAKTLLEFGEGRHEIRLHHGLIAKEAKGEVPGSSPTGWEVKTPLKEGVLATLKTSQRPAPQPSQAFSLPSFRIKIPHLSLKKLKIIALIFLFISPLLYLIGEAGFAFAKFRATQEALERFDLPAATFSSKDLSASLSRLNFILGFWADVKSGTAAGREIAQAIAEVSSRGEISTTSIDNLISSYRGEATKPQTSEDFRHLSRALENAEDHLSLAWLEIGKIGEPWKNYFAPLKEKVSEGLMAVKIGAAFASQAPELLGYQGVRSYLLLFQNSAELWAGGGVAGSLAEVILENGGIKKLTFFDIYDFEQYKDVYQTPLVLGTVPSPATHVSLNPDFSANAKTFASVFRQATGTKVDGVIGLDLHFAEELLGILGPIKLAGFENEINKESLFAVTTSEVEKEFFPGSSKKKRFIQALGEGILARFFTIEKEDYTKVAKLSWEQLLGKGILLYFTNPIIYREVVENGFAGTIAPEEGDYLFPLDHNGGTKGTVWVKRAIDYRVFNLNREGTMRGELKITWKNEGTSSWPAGDYKNFFRVLAPKETRLIEAKLDEEDVTSRIIASEEEGRGSLGLVVEIQPQASRTLKLTYDLPENLNLKNLSTYSLTIQKQPGTVGDVFHFSFEKPFGFKADGDLLFDGKLDQDHKFKIKLEEER